MLVFLYENNYTVYFDNLYKFEVSTINRNV